MPNNKEQSKSLSPNGQQQSHGKPGSEPAGVHLGGSTSKGQDQWPVIDYAKVAPTPLDRVQSGINLKPKNDGGYQAFIDKAMSSQQTSAEDQTSVKKAPAATKEKDVTDKTGNGQKGNNDKQQVYTDSEGKAWDPSRDPNVTVGKGEKGDNFIWSNPDPRIKHYPSASEVTGPQEKETPDTGKTGKSQQGQEKGKAKDRLAAALAARKQSRSDLAAKKAQPPTEGQFYDLKKEHESEQAGLQKRQDNPWILKPRSAAVLAGTNLALANMQSNPPFQSVFHYGHKGASNAEIVTNLAYTGAFAGFAYAQHKALKNREAENAQRRDWNEKMPDQQIEMLDPNNESFKFVRHAAASSAGITAAGIVGMNLDHRNPARGFIIGNSAAALGYGMAAAEGASTKARAKRVGKEYKKAVEKRNDVDAVRMNQGLSR